jgi:AcrR family transcriptional regulator
MASRKKPVDAPAVLHDHRLPDPTEVGEGEFAKSGLTRLRIMEAAVSVLAVEGYASMSTTAVAQEAGLTRAAMLYHFSSRMSLIEAVVHYVTRKRLEMYGEAMFGLDHNADYFDRAIDVAWEQLQTPEFLAFSELSTAARTDRELSAIFTPALAEFDRGRRATALKLFPKRHAEQPWFDLRRDIVRFLLEGLAQQGGMAFDAERRKAELIGFLKALSIEPESEAVLKKAKEWAGRRKRQPAHR